jgi:hypothetical protein
MPVQICTIEDLEKIKQDILEEIKRLLKDRDSSTSGIWLRSSEVCKLIGISASSLQNFRNSGILPFTKLNGTIFFKKGDIEKIMESNLVNKNIKK